MKKQTKFFINGVFLLALALLCVTIFPAILKHSTRFAHIENYIYYEIEFFLLTAGALYFAVSPRHYKNQILVILIGVLYYVLFVRLYPLWF